MQFMYGKNLWDLIKKVFIPLSLIKKNVKILFWNYLQIF